MKNAVTPALFALLVCTCSNASSPQQPTGDASVFVPGDGGLPDGAVAVTRQQVLDAAGLCALELYRSFRTRADALALAVAAWAAAPGDPATLPAAQQAWRDAMAIWQQAEIFRFGPAASRMQPGGADLRDEIYSWPVSDRCKVDQLLAVQGYGDPGLFGAFRDFRGLDAAEYLLFHPGSDNGCPSATSASFQMQWAALDAATIAQRKRAYAVVVTTDVAAKAAALVNAWEPTGGNFLAKVNMPQQPPFGSLQTALNALSDGMFYLELEVKDMKVMPPLGLMACASCPGPDEAPFAAIGKDNLRANLVGFQKLFQGCGPAGSGIGFDDLLYTIGAGALADGMLAALAGVQGAVEALPAGNFSAPAMAKTPEAMAVFTQIKTLTDLLKSQFITVLDLNRPQTVEGDND